ncbi:MAG: SDR family NAD(P)-dependent oxidoreductase [Oscillospiraceae bacterium]|nr:SDR family NAD(P)-dependent oxidoreductase [Oscillospiraceae bacterium]
MKHTEKKKTILITGTNRGLGLSLTKEFLRHGFIVFAGVYKLTTQGSEIQKMKDNENLHIIEMDVKDTSSVEKAAECVGSLTQSLDVLINNAGILCKESYYRKSNTIFDELDIDSMMDSYDVNALGAVRVANAFSHLLMKGEDKLLINISSDAACLTIGSTDWFGYRMSKAAMNMAGSLIHNEYVKHGGRVWQIHPGWMQTYMHGEKADNAVHSSDFAAEHIYKLVMESESQKSESLQFTDIHGRPMPW